MYQLSKSGTYTAGRFDVMVFRAARDRGTETKSITAEIAGRACGVCAISPPPDMRFREDSFSLPPSSAPAYVAKPIPCFRIRQTFQTDNGSISSMNRTQKKSPISIATTGGLSNVEVYARQIA